LTISLLWQILFYGWTASEMYIAIATRTRRGGGKQLDRGTIAAIAVLVAGLVIRWIAIVSLGKAFSANVAIRPTQSIYQSGLYRFVRHPSYSGLLLVFVAVALHERNWLAAAVVLVPTTAALLYRIHVEEAALHQAFGPQYEAYSKRTKRLIPAIY